MMHDTPAHLTAVNELIEELARQNSALRTTLREVLRVASLDLCSSDQERLAAIRRVVRAALEEGTQP